MSLRGSETTKQSPSRNIRHRIYEIEYLVPPSRGEKVSLLVDGRTGEAARRMRSNALRKPLPLLTSRVSDDLEGPFLLAVDASAVLLSVKPKRSISPDAFVPAGSPVPVEERNLVFVGYSFTCRL